MTASLATTLHTRFGHAAFRPGQAEAIENLLAGRHTLVVMPTGAGKSLIYQLAALHLPGLTLVISPLIALMKDQVDALRRQRITATFINSTLSADEQARRLRALARGDCRLAYVAPERLRSAPFQEVLRRVRVSLLAVDEAHCISQWGHDFRPDYLRLAAARPLLGEPVTAALTATATPQVQDDIVRLLGLPSARRIVTGFNRPNLSLRVQYTLDVAAKLLALRELLSELDGGGAIIYVGTRHDAEEVAEFVRTVAGLPVEHYHAGLDARVRTRVEEAFLGGDLPLVVATNAFGMGINRADVRLVAHYSLPGTLEAYYQEAGRAGRDGQPAQAVLLYAPRDRALQEWFIENSAPAAGEVRALYAAVRAMGRGKVWLTCEALSLATGLPLVKVRVGLAQLEAAGSLERLGDAGLRMLLRLGPWSEEALRREVAQVEEHRSRRRDQLARMVAYAEAGACRRRILLDHFGDRGSSQAESCCDNCLAGPRPDEPPPVGDTAQLAPAERVALSILDALRRLRWEIGRHKLAQLLKGSRAKAMRWYAYDRSPYYGRLADYTVTEIEGLIGQLLRRGYLKAVGGELPVLRLTPQGEAALLARAPIRLRLPHPPRPEVVAHKRAEREAGGTVALTARLFAQGLAPAEIAARRGLQASTIYTHLARLIEEGEVPLERVVPEAVVAQVRAAMAQAGVVAYASQVKALLPEEIGYGEVRCVLAAATREGQARALSTEQTEVLDDRSSPTASPRPLADAEREVADFLSRAHPKVLAGPWRAAWSLGFHSGFAGSDWARSPVGALTYRLKYQADQAALPPLVAQAVALCAAHPELAQVDALVPVPPSESRAFDPVRAFAQALAARLGRPVWPVLVKTRRTAPQKSMRTLAQKRANVAGAFAVRGSVRGKALLVVDDLYDSGATLAEISRVLARAGAARVCVLTLTKTIHSE